MKTKMKYPFFDRSAARACAAVLLLLGAVSCAAPRFTAALPDLQREGATAIAYDAKVSEPVAGTKTVRPDDELGRQGDRNIADALLDNGFFPVDTVRRMSTLPGTLAGAVRMVFTGSFNTPKRKLHTVIVPERLQEEARLTGRRFLVIARPLGTFREREDKYDLEHSEAILSLVVVDLQKKQVLYRGKNRMSIDPLWPENARTQVRILLGDLFAGRITDAID